jgi:hypothetical protein
MKSILILLFGLLVAVNASSGNEDIPKIGSVSEVYLGDSMVTQRNGYNQKCLRINKRYEKKCCLGGLRQLEADSLMCLNGGSDSSYDLPTSSFLSATGFIHNKNGVQPSRYLFKPRKKGKVRVEASPAGAKVADITLEEFERDFSREDHYIICDSDFQKRVEYTGKQGSNLSFQYSEFTDNMARPAFSKDFSLDMSEGSVGAYKGFVFEVLDASNATIKYKVMRHFPPQGGFKRC